MELPLYLTSCIFLDRYPTLKEALFEIIDSNELTQVFMQLSNFNALLTVHYINFILVINPIAPNWVCSCMQ